MTIQFSGPPDLEGQVALLTGATGDIGATLGPALVDCGATVIATDIYTSNDLFSSYENIHYYALDVTSKSRVNEVITNIKKEFGRLDIAVLAAGIAAINPIDQITDEEWENVMRVNAYGVMNVSRSVVPLMQERGYGKIVAIGSIAGHTGGGASGLAYAASKAAVHALIKNIAQTGASNGIYANAVAPGPVTGKMWHDVINHGMPPDPASIFPLNREGSPSDIAQAIIFLASQQSNWITGQVLNINGGMLMI